MSSTVASASKVCFAARSADTAALLATNSSRRGSVASVSSVGGGTGFDCSQPRSDRNCGSNDSIWHSAVVPVRGMPLMSIKPRSVSCSISG